MVVLVAGAVVYLTLRPFVLRMPGSFQAIVDAAVSYDRETLQHIVPAIVVVMLVRAGWGFGPGRAAIFSFAGLFALECVQLFIEHRHARMGDLLAQGVGLAVGARLPILPISALAWRSAWAVTLLAWVAMVITVGVRGQFGHTLGPMDTTFRLVVADEYGGGRPWRGDVRGFSIETDAATEPIVAFGPPPGDGDTWLGEGTTPIALTPAHAGWSSVDPVPALCRALDDALAITVRLDITSASIDQDGPARILTVSKGLSWRNLTIGQAGDALVLRIRTPRSGPNAASPQFVFHGIFAEGRPRAIRLWTDGGSARLWVDDRLVGEQFSYITPRDWLGLKPGPAEAAGVVALFAPIGLALGMLWAGGRPRRSRQNARRVWIAGALVPIVILGAIWGTSVVLNRPVAWWLLPGSVGAAFLGVAVAGWLKERR